MKVVTTVKKAQQGVVRVESSGLPRCSGCNRPTPRHAPIGRGGALVPYCGDCAKDYNGKEKEKEK